MTFKIIGLRLTIRKVFGENHLIKLISKYANLIPNYDKTKILNQ